MMYCLGNIKKTVRHNTEFHEIFSEVLISRILDRFSSLEGTNFREIWISDFTPDGNNFSRISCMVIENNKNESHVVVFSNVMRGS